VFVSQSVGPVNTIIAATVAKSFKDFACAIENGQDIDSVVVKALNDNWHVSGFSRLSLSELVNGTIYILVDGYFISGYYLLLHD
jgi:hypothetical protein